MGKPGRDLHRGPLVRSEVAGERMRAWDEKSVRREKQRGEESWVQKSRAAPSQGQVPLALRAFVSGVRSSPLLATAVNPAFLRPRFPSAELLRRLLPTSTVAGLLQKKADCARHRRMRRRARLPVRRAQACFVLELAGTSRTGSGRAAAPTGSGAAPAPLPLRLRAREPRGGGGPSEPLGRNLGRRSQANQDRAQPLLRAEDGRRGAGPVRLL